MANGAQKGSNIIQGDFSRQREAEIARNLALAKSESRSNNLIQMAGQPDRANIINVDFGQKKEPQTATPRRSPEELDEENEEEESENDEEFEETTEDEEEDEEEQEDESAEKQGDKEETTEKKEKPKKEDKEEEASKLLTDTPEKKAMMEKELAEKKGQAKKEGEAGPDNSAQSPEQPPEAPSTRPKDQAAGVKGGQIASQMKDKAKDTLEDVAKDIGKKVVKEAIKRGVVYVISAIGAFLASTAWIWAPIVIGVTICGMIFAFTYDYWQKNAYNPLLYVKFFTSGPTQLIMDAVANTAGKTEYGGKAAKEDTKPKPATGASAVGATPVPTTNK